jgi:nucleoside-diphosphate-sugar epimerase
VIPALIRKFENARKHSTDVTLWGDGTPTREFLFVKDAAQAVVATLQAPVFTGPCNIGTGKEISIAMLAAKIAALCGYRGHIRFDAREPNGQLRRCLDVSRAKKLLGWTASTSLEDGLRETILWYRSLRTPGSAA